MNDDLRKQQYPAESSRAQVAMIETKEPWPEADVRQTQDGWLGGSLTLQTAPSTCAS